MNQFLRLFNLAILKGISFIWILTCFARLFPYLLSLALPMSFLVALLLSLGQLTERGEVVALRSSGFSFAEILWPYFVISVLFSIALLYVNHKASPEGFHSFKNRYSNALAQVSRADLEPGAFTEVGEWRLKARSVGRRDGRLGGVYLIKMRGERVGMRVDAPRGLLKVEKEIGFVLELYQGSIQMPDPDPSKYLTATFATYRIVIPLVAPSVGGRSLDLQELNSNQLESKLNSPEIDLSHRMEYLTEIALRSVGALTPFVFFWLGCPIGLGLEKNPKTSGFGLGLGILFFYYGLVAVGVGLGRRHLGFSSLAPWLPIAAGLLAGASLWRLRLRR